MRVSKLKIGETYWVRYVISMSHRGPQYRSKRKMQLIDIRKDGSLLMAYDVLQREVPIDVYENLPPEKKKKVKDVMRRFYRDVKPVDVIMPVDAVQTTQESL